MNATSDLLITAIIKRAMSDYKAALKAEHPHQRKELERFFLGEWGEMLTGGRGALIMEHCRKTTIREEREREKECTKRKIQRATI